MSLANIKSAKKRIKVSERQRLRNKMIRSKTKTAVKKVVAACESNDKVLATSELKLAIAEIDKACTKGIYHKKNVARQKSKLTKKVNSLA